MAFKARKRDLRRVEAGNGIERSITTMYLLKGWTGLYISEVHISIQSFCLFISWGCMEPSRAERLCYQSCKMVYCPVSNCTWKGTSNLYEKCLRLPAHSVIHARSVSVMPENKRRCTSLERNTLYALRAREGKHSNAISQMNWSLPLPKSWGLWDWGRGKEFSFDLTGL